MFGWILLAGAVAALAGSLTLATVAAQHLLRPRRRLPVSTPAEVGLAHEEVSFQACGEAIVKANRVRPRRAGQLRMRWSLSMGGLHARWELIDPAQPGPDQRYLEATTAAVVAEELPVER